MFIYVKLANYIPGNIDERNNYLGPFQLYSFDSNSKDKKAEVTEMPSKNNDQNSMKYSIWETRVDEKQKEKIEKSPELNHEHNFDGKNLGK
ncbi:hypothetical protein AM500_17545 [Bacillus sp. FJAT-18017]|uniref:hypothetical protein n=1 Tax=Bacillus sp. FJAT-18017 TaxID=1705566 RepID=UPI0006AF155F|nr:hypothetical protein [Bacillus sp. FJAT-18017]ALC91402.1 hypothetical protein AM500_17545 [Bacillus sp. FJAT-18017]